MSSRRADRQMLGHASGLGGLRKPLGFAELGEMLLTRYCSSASCAGGSFASGWFVVACCALLRCAEEVECLTDWCQENLDSAVGKFRSSIGLTPSMGLWIRSEESTSLRTSLCWRGSTTSFLPHTPEEFGLRDPAVWSHDHSAVAIETVSLPEAERRMMGETYRETRERGTGEMMESWLTWQQNDGIQVKAREERRGEERRGEHRETADLTAEHQRMELKHL
ncbi:hypothetical protein DNTS_012312 [Danionella cerebrum]|uniref:Uncharacterized protein n=1 Tax=Danionella cerebrum TaxID=2873325 RepID=A0A553RER5_9TELE|nr:hypothetical protein DNTS_012312 [Danionella translucida]